MSMILSDSWKAALAASIRMSISNASVILGESMNVITDPLAWTSSAKKTTNGG